MDAHDLADQRGHDAGPGEVCDRAVVVIQECDDAVARLEGWGGAVVVPVDQRGVGTVQLNRATVFGAEWEGGGETLRELVFPFFEFVRFEGGERDRVGIGYMFHFFLFFFWRGSGC